GDRPLQRLGYIPNPLFKVEITNSGRTDLADTRTCVDGEQGECARNIVREVGEKPVELFWGEDGDRFDGDLPGPNTGCGIARHNLEETGFAEHRAKHGSHRSRVYRAVLRFDAVDEVAEVEGANVSHATLPQRGDDVVLQQEGVLPDGAGGSSVLDSAKEDVRELCERDLRDLVVRKFASRDDTFLLLEGERCSSLRLFFGVERSDADLPTVVRSVDPGVPEPPILRLSLLRPDASHVRLPLPACGCDLAPNGPLLAAC